MARARRQQIVDVLRQRIITGLGTGALDPGDRLPSTRVLAVELAADPRVVSAAYRTLEDEALVELRPRAGVFVRADSALARRSRRPSSDDIAQLLTQQSMRGYAARELLHTLARVVEGPVVRIVVIAATADQGLGIAAELDEEFGVESRAITVDRVKSPSGAALLRQASVLVSTTAHATLVRSLAESSGARAVVMSVRPDLWQTEWAVWQGQAAHVVVLDPRFRAIVRRFLADAGPSYASIRVHLATDDLSRLPEDVPVYVTRASRAHLGDTRLPGRLIPPARVLNEDCVLELWSVIAGLRLDPHRRAGRRAHPAGSARREAGHVPPYHS